MSRWKSPQTAARHAQRSTKAAEQNRRENRKSLLLVIAIAAGLTAIMVGDYVWLRSKARQRQEQHQQGRHRLTQTNVPGNATLGAGETNSTGTP